MVTNFSELVQALVSDDAEFQRTTADMNFEQEQMNQLLALRGLLGHDVLLSCLQKRFGVDFGLTER